MYVTINPVIMDDIVLAIGQRWTIRDDVDSYSVWSNLELRPKVGEQLTIRNIIAPDYDTGLQSMFVCCEFERDIGGHPCSADRGNRPPWDPTLLCIEGQGEYVALDMLIKIADQERQEATWEL